MKSWKPAPRSMVILYFGGFVLLWSGIAAGLLAGRDFAAPDSVLPFRGVHPYLVPGIVGLALHAALIVLLAWKADRWLFAHGPVAVVLAGAPLIPLVENLWFVPAFLYLIAVLHVWLASLPRVARAAAGVAAPSAPDEGARLRSAATKSWAAGESRRFARVRSSVALPPHRKVERQPREQSVLRVVQREIERQHRHGVAALQQRERRDDRHGFDEVARQRAAGRAPAARRRRPASGSRADAGSTSCRRATRASIRGACAQRMAGARDEAQRLVAQRQDVEFGELGVRGQLSDRDVERALTQRGGEHVARVDQHEHLEARASAPHRCSAGATRPRHRPGHGTDAQLARGAGGERRDLVARLATVGEHAARVADQRFAVGRGLHAPRVTVEERHAEGVLEVGSSFVSPRAA